MNKLTAITLILLSFFLQKRELKAQQYQSLFGNDFTSWKIVHGNLDVLYTDSLWTGEDTTYNLHTYKKIYASARCCQPIGFLREDSVSSKAWFDLYPSDTKETLIMNLNLAEGDSFYVDASWLVNTGWKFVDSVFLKNGKKHVRVNCLTAWGDKITLIEGVGSNAGIEYLETNGNVSPYLLCLYQDLLLSYSNDNSNFNQCDLATSIIDTTNHFENPKLEIYPNPSVTENVTFTYTVSSEAGVITIYNIEGKEIAHYSIPQWSSVQHLKLPKMADGVYMARLTQGKAVAGVKFLKE